MKSFNSYKKKPKWGTSKTSYKPTRSRFIDRTGQKIGKLTLKYPVKLKKTIYWVCFCDCGNKVTISSLSLLRGATKSCGCVRKEMIIKRNHKGWKGYGDISGNYIGQIKYNAKSRNIKFDLDVEYLWKLFVKQNKKCALSGLILVFGDKRKRKIDQTASLDRIDSNKGYIKGNVQWVHKVVNLMKGCQNSKSFIKFCTDIARYNNGK